MVQQEFVSDNIRISKLQHDMVDLVDLGLRNLILKMVSQNASDRPQIREVMDYWYLISPLFKFSHEFTFPGTFYSYLHPYICLLPIMLAKENDAIAVGMTVEQVSKDLEDIVFILNLDRDPAAEPACEMIFERILIYLLRGSRRGSEQEEILECLEGFADAGWNQNLFSTIIYPLIMDIFPRLSCDSKVFVLKLMSRQNIVVEGHIRQHMVLTLADKVKADEHTGVLDAASELYHHIFGNILLTNQVPILTPPVFHDSD